MRWNLRVMVLLCVAVAMSMTPVAAAPAAAEPAVVAAFAQRLELAKKQLPLITRSAEAAAARVIANPQALIDVPYAGQASFCEELVNRAGELANALPPEERMKLVTPSDVVLVSARSWEKDGRWAATMIASWQKKGARVVVFASREGMPADVHPDDLIDNGATGSGEELGAVNHLANVLNSHLWTCEYAAALTRRGKHPGVLYAMVMPHSDAHNRPLQANGASRRFLGDAPSAIPAGQLGGVYLHAVDEVLAAVRGEASRRQVDAAADLIAAQLASGGKVGVSSCTHILMDEVFRNRLTPMKPFNVVWHAATVFPHELRAGDVLVWFSYIGLRTISEDYTTPIRKTHARVVTCFLTDANADNNAPDAAAHIEQHWKLPDAVVPVPFPPGVMSPVSGIDQGLLYRELEEAVAERLRTKAAGAPSRDAVGG